MSKPDASLTIDDQDQLLPSSLTQETVLSVKHWTERLFSFRITRPVAFRFRSGEFVMIGLFRDGKPLLRAYSIASPAWDEDLEFYSIKVAGGPLTSRLQSLKPGDKVLLGKKPTGTLILDALTPGRTLYMFSTGTGIAPFASLIRDPETYQKFDTVVLTQTCRKTSELQYGFSIVADVKEDPLVSDIVADKLLHRTSVTQETYHRTGRITEWILSGDLFRDLGFHELNAKTDRVMICGSTAMLNDTKSIVEGYGLIEGSNSRPGDYVVEKAFAD